MGVNLRTELLNASRVHFEAHIEKHRVNVENMLNNTVGVAEHPDVMDTIEKELAIIAEYEDKLHVLDKYFGYNKDKNDNRYLSGQLKDPKGKDESPF